MGFHVAHAQAATNDSEEAIKTAEEAVDVCKEMENKRWEATVKEFLVEMSLQASDLEKAEETATEGLQLLQDIDAMEDEAVFRMHVSSRVQHMKDDTNAALEECKTARDLAQKAEEKNLEAL